VSNVSIITDTAKDSNLRTVQDYNAGVYSHLGSDFDGHRDVKIHTVPYTDNQGDIVGLQTLRLTLTDTAAGDSSIVLALPVNSTGTTVATAVPPIITRQPTAANREIGDAFQFIVSAISDVALTYQWQKNSVSIAGAAQQRLVFPSLVITDSGAYRVVVVNSNGTTISNSVVLTVTKATSRARTTLSNQDTLPAVK